MCTLCTRRMFPGPPGTGPSGPQMAADLASSQLKQMTGERELIATSPPTDKLSTGTVCDGTAADD